MKKTISGILVCLLVCAIFVGCKKQPTAQYVGMANPWTDWSSLDEAEAAVGFSFGLPEVIADSYTAANFRTMNKELLEIIYRDADSQICIRKQKGEDQDISGDYNEYDTCTEENIGSCKIIRYRDSQSGAVKQLISYAGYSWSLVTTDCSWDLAASILQQ